MIGQGIELRDGRTMPCLGLGVWKTPIDQAAEVVQYAFSAGYRHVDIASAYNNEEGVGAGVRESGCKREDVFVTTKVWNSDQGFDRTLRAFDNSLKRLGLTHID